MVLNFGKVAAGLPSPFLFLLLASLVTAGSSGLPSGGFQMGGEGTLQQITKQPVIPRHLPVYNELTGLRVSHLAAAVIPKQPYT